MAEPDGRASWIGPMKTGIALIAVAVLLLIAWLAARLILMVFAGVLFGIFLEAIASWTARKTRLTYGWSLALVLVILAAAAGLASWQAFPRLASQASELADELPKAVRGVRSAIQSSPLSGAMPAGESGLESIRGSVLSRVGTAAAAALDAAVAAIVIVFVGIYLAADPRQYRGGFVRLIPPKRRQRTREVLTEIGQVLRRWLVARIVLMVINGGLTVIGLWIIGIPLALVLGFIAGLLNFVPNIGPFIAAVPAILIGWGQGPEEAGYVAGLYLGLQMIDGYVFTPLAQKFAVSLAPALVITFQVLMGILAGPLGLLLATPIAAALVVVIRMVYLQDVLGEKPVPSER